MNGVDVRSGGAVVDERLLGRTPFEELVVAFFGVPLHSGGDILNVRYGEDSQASKAKLFGRIKRTTILGCGGGRGWATVLSTAEERCCACAAKQEERRGRAWDVGE